MSFDPIVFAAVRKLNSGSPTTGSTFPVGMVLQGYGIKDTLKLDGSIVLKTDYPELATALEGNPDVLTKSYSLVLASSLVHTTVGAASYNNLVVAINSDTTSTVSISPDGGTSWSSSTLPVAGKVLNTIACKGSSSDYIAFAGDTSASSNLVFLFDGTTWTSSSITAGNWIEPVWTGYTWFTVDNSATRSTARSADGITWTYLPVTASPFQEISVYSKLVTDGVSGFLVYSNATGDYAISPDDGDNWITITSPSNNMYVQSYNPTTGYFVASAQGAPETVIYKSSDVYNWFGVKLLDIPFSVCDIRCDGAVFAIALVDVPALFVSSNLDEQEVSGFSQNSGGLLCADSGSKAFLTNNSFSLTRQFDTATHFKVPDLSDATNDIPYVIQAK